MDLIYIIKFTQPPLPRPLFHDPLLPCNADIIYSSSLTQIATDKVSFFRLLIIAHPVPISAFPSAIRAAIHRRRADAERSSEASPEAGSAFPPAPHGADVVGALVLAVAVLRVRGSGRGFRCWRRCGLWLCDYNSENISHIV